MREWCACGAAIRARRRDVIEWRANHRCPDRPASGGEAVHVSAGASSEHAGHRYYDGDTPIVQARIGFLPNQAST